MSEELISWEEAEWTRQALNISIPDFAKLLGVEVGVVHRGLKHPGSYLNRQAALMLRLGVNRRQAKC